MLARVLSYALDGIDGYLVSVEANVSGGMPLFEIVGLPDAAVKESRERVRAALANSGFTMPFTRVVLNLAPAGTKKTGPVFDLPIALAILCASGQLSPAATEGIVFLGELSMGGELAAVRGALPVALSAGKAGYTRLLLPQQSAPEVSCVEGLTVYPAASLAEVARHLRGEAPIAPQPQQRYAEAVASQTGKDDLCLVAGQHMAKRALEIAAAGGHSLLMVGPPGTGKTMLARCLPSLLPDMTFAESLEVTRIHSAAGILPPGAGLLTQRPFRAPHHSASLAALVGGGKDAHPGEVTLATGGVLFLDELPEFPRNVLDGLRQPLEDGKVVIARAGARSEYPARAMLVASMNPCPCGYYNHPAKECTCAPGAVRKYLAKISGPLLDRIDIHSEVIPVELDKLASSADSEPSSAIQARVVAARAVQNERFAPGVHCNAQMPAPLLKKFCVLDDSCSKLLKMAMQRFGLSARAYDRIVKLARTIADLDRQPRIRAEHIAEAIQYRSLDREGWGN